MGALLAWHVLKIWFEYNNDRPLIMSVGGQTSNVEAGVACDDFRAKDVSDGNVCCGGIIMQAC